MIKRFIVKACVWIAGRHTACAALWNDVADAVLTGTSIAEIRKSEKRRQDQ